MEKEKQSAPWLMIGIAAAATLVGGGLFGLVGGLVALIAGLVIGALAQAGQDGVFKNGFSFEKMGDALLQRTTNDPTAKIDLLKAGGESFEKTGLPLGETAAVGGAGLLAVATPPGRWLLRKTIVAPIRWGLGLFGGASGAPNATQALVNTAAAGKQVVNAVHVSARTAQAANTLGTLGSMEVPGSAVVGALATAQRWNSGITAARHGIDYATGERPVDYDNLSSTTMQVAPIVASGPIAAGVLLGDQVFARAVNYATTGKAESISAIMDDTTSIYNKEAKRFQAGELDPALRPAQKPPETDYPLPYKPQMTDYKHLGAIRHQLAALAPAGADKQVLAEFATLDMTQKENHMKYAKLIDAAIVEQEAIKQKHKSILPNWMRGTTWWKRDEGVHAFNDANGNLQVLNVAKKELEAFKEKAGVYARAVEEQRQHTQVIAGKTMPSANAQISGGQHVEHAATPALVAKTQGQNLQTPH